MLAASCHAPQLQKVLGGGFCNAVSDFTATSSSFLSSFFASDLLSSGVELVAAAPLLPLPDDPPPLDSVLPAAGMEAGIAATFSGVKSPSCGTEGLPVVTVLMMSFSAWTTGLIGAEAVGGDNTWQSVEFGAIVQMSGTVGTGTVAVGIGVGFGTQG